MNLLYIIEKKSKCSDNIYVYSAFLEDRQLERNHFDQSKAIRLIGVAKFLKKYFGQFRLNFEIVCRFWYDEDETTNTAE